MRNRQVVVVGLGGTIAMTPGAAGGVVPSLSTDELVAALPGLAGSKIDVQVLDFRRVPGAAVDIADLLALSRTITVLLDQGADGIVITQGTDTVEESAFLLDLYHSEDQPVVVTGAMRNPSLAGADGPANLLAAIQTAASPEAAGLGVLVVFADEIHAATRVRKTHSTSTGTFKSPNGGPLGYVVEGRPHILSHRPQRTTLPLPAHDLPPVGLVTIGIGDRGELLEGIESKVEALVVAAMGAGHVPDRIVKTLERLAGIMPVILASRTGSGPVLTETYGFTGSERDLIARGLLPAGFLDPFKARLLVAASLAAGAGRDQIAEALREVTP
jgi:L-asparaginase